MNSNFPFFLQGNYHSRGSLKVANQLELEENGYIDADFINPKSSFE